MANLVTSGHQYAEPGDEATLDISELIIVDNAGVHSLSLPRGRQPAARLLAGGGGYVATIGAPAGGELRIIQQGVVVFVV